MGALVYEPATHQEKTDLDVDLELLAQNSRQLMAGKTLEVLPQLIKTGGSPGRARPRVFCPEQGFQ